MKTNKKEIQNKFMSSQYFNNIIETNAFYFKIIGVTNKTDFIKFCILNTIESESKDFWSTEYGEHIDSFKLEEVEKYKEQKIKFNKLLLEKKFLYDMAVEDDKKSIQESEFWEKYKNFCIRFGFQDL